MKTAHDLVMAAKALIREVSLDDAEQAIRDADVLLDVREADEFAAGHLPGALHISRGMLEFKLAGTPRTEQSRLEACALLQDRRPRCTRGQSPAGHGLCPRSVPRLGASMPGQPQAVRVARPSLPAFD
jgi:hypothetical protein